MTHIIHSVVTFSAVRLLGWMLLITCMWRSKRRNVWPWNFYFYNKVEFWILGLVRVVLFVILLNLLCFIFLLILPNVCRTSTLLVSFLVPLLSWSSFLCLYSLGLLSCASTLLVSSLVLYFPADSAKRMQGLYSLGLLSCASTLLVFFLVPLLSWSSFLCLYSLGLLSCVSTLLVSFNVFVHHSKFI